MERLRRSRSSAADASLDGFTAVPVLPRRSAAAAVAAEAPGRRGGRGGGRGMRWSRGRRTFARWKPRIEAAEGVVQPVTERGEGTVHRHRCVACPCPLGGREDGGPASDGRGRCPPPQDRRPGRSRDRGSRRRSRSPGSPPGLVARLLLDVRDPLGVVIVRARRDNRTLLARQDSVAAPPVRRPKRPGPRFLRLALGLVASVRQFSASSPGRRRPLAGQIDRGRRAPPLPASRAEHGSTAASRPRLRGQELDRWSSEPPPKMK